MANMIIAAFRALRDGDKWVRLSALFWASSCLARRQYAKAVLLCLEQAFFLTTILLCMPSILKLPTLGTVPAQRVYDPVSRRNVWNDYDNSFLILLFGVLGLVLLFVGTIQWLRNLHDAFRTQQQAANGKPLPDARGLLQIAMGQRFHKLLLAGPVTGVSAVMLIPLFVMVLIAFTNYDRNHLVPTNLFTWVGLDNFRALAGLTAGGSFAYALKKVLAWTLVWAAFSTLSCYTGGIGLAMLINHRRTRGKRFWRSCFMAAMAVPQFVSLLLVRSLFADVGLLNTLCKSVGLTDWLYRAGAIPTANVIPFLTSAAWARPTILLINLWVGVPYQLLVATGILINIPAELAEAARIDGAGSGQVFRHITLPYLLAITAPSLVSSLVANVNNFSVIWLLTRDVYVTTDQAMAAAGAAEVDLLVTWLYRLTQDQSNYKMASVIGILVFLICSALTLAAFRRLTGRDKEANFQ